MKQAGIVMDRRDAQWVRSRINPDLSPPLTRSVQVASDHGLPISEAAA
jgi:ArsR family transcriptional regulator